MNAATERAIQNNIDIQRAVQQVVAEARESRPKNTRKNYDGKQLEWRSWCDQKDFTDGKMVSEGKLLLYLKEVVVPRGSGKVENGERLPLSADGLEGYVKAIVDLYSTQRTLDGNSHPHPRGKALSNYLSTHKRSRSKRKRLEYQDRGEGTVQDTYSSDELKAIAAHFLALQSARALRDRVDFLVGHALMARGETTRKMQLPDLFSMEIEHEGPTRCVAVMVIMDQGKMNQVGRIEYGGFVRHRDVIVCPVGALALYLFWRFQVHGEVFPNMFDRRSWYDIHVIDGKQPEQEVSYATQASGLKKAMSACGVVSRKVTHIRRTSSCVIAEANGASDASIRRGGRWNNEKMERCYLTTLPKEVVRALAGFNVSGGQFFLPRAECDVPPELSKRVFPAIEQMQAAFDSKQIQDIAGQGFLRLLVFLRDVIIQDSVLLRRACPGHPVWRHSVFSSPEYVAFADTAERKLQASAERMILPSVQAAMPILSNVVESGFGSLSLRMAALESTLQRVHTDVQHISKGKITVAFVPDNAVETQQRPEAASTPMDPSSYRLSRALRSVTDVWQEYEHVWQGGPSVRELEKNYGPTWRRSETERKYFSRRKIFYDAIQYVAAERQLPPIGVAALLDAHREQCKMSLDAYMKLLKARGASSIAL